MAVLTSSSTFTVGATTVAEEAVDLILMPENSGVDAFRELHYPNNVLAPLVYQKNPDKWINFDSTELVERPVLKYTKTLEAGVLTRWSPYIQDQVIKEFWRGSGSTLSMPAYFFRRLWEFYANPPDEDYILWYPKDRTTAAYQIEIESLSVGGEEVVNMDYAALSNGYILDEVVFTFRLIGTI